MAVNGNRIKQLRKQSGLTQEELGKKMGVIKQTVSSWENNVSEPNSESLLNLASLFNVSIDYLLGNDQTNNTFHTRDKGKKGHSSGKGFFFFFFEEESDTQKVFTTRIKTAISDRGLTEEEFQNKISFDKEKTTALLAGRYQPTANDLIALSQFLNTSIDYLLGQTPKTGSAEKKFLDAFIHLNTDNQDIIIGKIKELLKEQRHESVAADPFPLKKTGTDNLGK